MIKCPICQQERPVPGLTKKLLEGLPAAKIQKVIMLESKIAERERPYARHYSKTFNRARNRARRAEGVLSNGKAKKKS